MDFNYKVLIVEDQPFDAELAKREISNHLKSFTSLIVDNEQDYIQVLKEFRPDIIVSDYKMPSFSGLKALQIMQRNSLMIPFIILTGAQNEEIAVQCMKAGADDYVLKDSILRLGPAILHALKHHENIKQKSIAEAEVVKLSAAVKQSPSVITITDLKGKFVYANPKFTSLTGYLVQEVIGEKPSILKSGDMPDEEYANLWRTIRKGDTWRGEFKNIKKNGDAFWEYASIGPIINEEGEIINYLKVAEDISEKKHAEEQLKAAHEELKRLKSRVEDQNIYLRNELSGTFNFGEIVGETEVMKEMFEQIEMVAETDSAVFIEGETGTGKELVARAIHERSKRKSNPLVKINCSAIPSELIESELFGYEKGSFTGADHKKVGRFELADKGTIFLDEIGDLPVLQQVKLLRVLQEGEIDRIGGTKTIKVDVRVIAASNRDFEKLMEEGKFRQDLYFRLKVFPIECPSLNVRKEDIPLLANYFVNKFNPRMNNKITSIPKNELNKLSDYGWPGNVRELENVIERAMILSRESKLEIGGWFNKKEQNSERDYSGLSLSDFERKYIIQVLEEKQWKIRGNNGAAAMLGVPPTTLESKMKKLGISRATRSILN